MVLASSCELPATGGTSAAIAALATCLLLAGICLVGAGRRRSLSLAAALVVVSVLSVTAASQRADAVDPACSSPTTAAAAATEAVPTTSSAVPTTTTVAVAPTGTVRGIYRTSSAASGSAFLPAATVVLISAGPDGLLGTSDDTTATTVTAADGTYTFTNVPVGPARLTTTDLPPSEEYSLEWNGDANQLTLSGTWAANNALAQGSTVHFSGLDGVGTPIDITQAVGSGVSFTTSLLGSYLVGTVTFVATAGGSTTRTASLSLDYCGGSSEMSAWALVAGTQDVVVQNAITTNVTFVATTVEVPPTTSCR
jgi:LPXTG-motif cell wall-anchored protein